MSDNRLRWRLNRLELDRPAPNTGMVVRAEEQAPLGRPVAVMPMPCTTADEWLAKYRPEANHG